jgi:uncharacterized protein (DUF697 family)
MDDLGNACAGLSADELNELKEIVVLYAEASGLVIKLASWVGGQAESLIHKVPDDWQSLIEEATDLALRESYRLAFASQADEQSDSMLNRALGWASGEQWHTVATGITGAISGLGGIGTAFADIPVTTTLILRSIQQIAAGYGEDVADEEVRAHCLAVFGFGGPLTEDDEAETGLFASRIALTGKTVAETMKAVLPRLGVVVSEKLLAQATPLIGAVTGATVNTAFSNYYQTMAHVHFRLRRLERNRDRDQVMACFERILSRRRTQKRTLNGKTSAPSSA